MITKLISKSLLLSLAFISIEACNIPLNTSRKENNSVPAAYFSSVDSTNVARLSCKKIFSDAYLHSLIDTALKNNQELNIVKQEIEIRKNEVRARKGEYLPFVGLMGGSNIEKVGKYTWRGGVEQNIDNKNNPEIIESKSDFIFGATASWELDVWKKLRNSKNAAAARYLSSIEGKNFLVTNLIAEIANSYFELMALDNLLEIVQKNILIQSDALRIVKEEKEAAKVTQLAVNRFEAQLLNTQNLQYDIKQKIIETENKINFLTGRFPSPIPRNSSDFNNVPLDSLKVGVPSQLLVNRPDIRQAEKELMASKLDVKVARANFYPSLRITGQYGFQAFNPSYLINPESMIYNLAGELVAPLINRNGIKAAFYSANARQVQAMFAYERSILNAVMEVNNQLSKMSNFSKSYATKAKEVDILTQSITVSNNLFKAARADYMEVLLTQREALESKMELIETRLQWMNSRVNIYKVLGGGWN
jgi:outer membrane protein, multidrug efflux system